jgi:hypothetical protein
MVKLSDTRCSFVAILWVSLVSFATVTLCVASQRVSIFVSIYFFMTQSGNLWIHPRKSIPVISCSIDTASLNNQLAVQVFQYVMTQLLTYADATEGQTMTSEVQGRIDDHHFAKTEECRKSLDADSTSAATCIEIELSTLPAVHS